MKREYADTKWGQIHYRFDGRGEALILLHQSPSSSVMFEKAIPVLGRHYRTIALDTIGYGDSDKPTQQMDIPDYARSIVNFLDALGIEQANVLGHHTGGGLGIELAASFPERVNKLIVYGVPYWEKEEREHMLATWAPPLTLREDGSHLVELWERAKKLTPNAGAQLWQRNVLQTMKAGEYYNSAYNAMFRFDVGPRLPLVKCPTLLLCGDKDMLFKANKPVLAKLPKAREVIIPGAGGLVIDQNTDEYTREVLDFLANSGI